MCIIRPMIFVAGCLTFATGTVLLTSDKEYAPLYGQIMLTCSIDMDGVKDVRFKKGKDQIGSCDLFECQLKNISKYNVSKNTQPIGYDLFYFTINDFRETDSDEYHCDVVANGESGSKHITYAVSITSVTLTPSMDPISVIENVQQQFMCVTSVSRPEAVVKWYLDGEQLTSGIVTSTSQDATKSTLTYTPEKLHQDRNISCRGSNGGQELTSTNKPTLNIFYGPSIPKCNYSGSAMPSIIKVREGFEVRLNCNSIGKPTPTFSWSHPGDGPSSPLVLSNIRRTHHGIFNISAISHLVPPIQQTQNLFSFIITTVQILYPPDPPSCRVGSATLTSSSMFAIRGTTFSMNCSCDSNPASSYSWSMTGVSSETTGQYFELPVQDTTNVKLTMVNTMLSTNGSTEQGRREFSFKVNILFPPVVKPHTSVVALEGGNTSVACLVTVGFPNKTDFKWERMADMTPVSMEQTLGIINIGRTQSGYYRCTASNLMGPTGYDSTVGNSSNTVYIDVQYEAKVTNFTLPNVAYGQDFQVNENTQVIFHCQAQSNPLSKIALFKHNEDLKTASNTNDLEFTISSSECEDDGTYQCTAQNIHNAQADVRSLTLFVRCAPRATTSSPRHQNVTSATGVPAELTLKLVAFPRPSVKDFVWEKKDSATNTWHTVSNDTDIAIIISADRLHTDLFFSSVKKKNFGYYRVHVNNELGNYTETYKLQAQERPHTPFNLQHFQKATVETIYIEWTAGFDGGLPQTFHVEYRDVGSSLWRNDRVIAGHMHHTVVGLSPDTNYEIRVYSINDIGRSNASEVITVRTLEKTTTGITTAVIISVLVIAVCGVVAIVVVVKKRRKRKMTEGVNRITTEDKPHSMSNMHDTDDDDVAEVINPIYEEGDNALDRTNKTDALYSQPHKKETANVSSGAGDVYSVVQKTPKGKKGTPKTKKTKKTKDSEDVYENAENPRGVQDRNTAHTIDTNENRDVPLAMKPTKKNVNKDGLIYADLEFSNPPKGQKRLVIHGLDDMTEYAAVDLTKKAKPLPESDDDEHKSPLK